MNVIGRVEAPLGCPVGQDPVKHRLKAEVQQYPEQQAKLTRNGRLV
jgi:hypothetical protein